MFTVYSYLTPFIDNNKKWRIIVIYVALFIMT